MSAPFDAAWLIEALIASSLLMALVLATRKQAQRVLGPQLAYWLWALPALRMAMPPLPASWRESAAAPLSAASETVLVYVQPMVGPAADAAAAPFPWLALLAGAWGLGALAFFVWHGLAHFHYVRRIVSPPARHERLADGTTLVESDEASGPVAFGVLKRFVAVPRDFAERYDEDERKLALAHELGHHARGDLVANWVALAMLAVHWFNPLAWIAYRKFRGDQEMANDARVLSALPPIERHAYACAIVKAAHGRAVTAACHLHTIEDLKGRLKMLKASRKSRRVLMAGAVGIAGLTIAGLGMTASGAAAEKIHAAATAQVPVMLSEAAAAIAPAAPTTEHRTVEYSVHESDDGKGPARSSKLVIRGKDGITRTYTDAEADAYLAAHPEMRPPAAPIERRRIVIRGKDGKTQVYEGDAARAYLDTHPDVRPPLPPAPPAPPAPAGAAMAAPLPPTAPSVMVMSDGRGGRHVIRSGAGAYAYAAAYAPEVVSGDCSGGNEREFVRSENKNGRTRMVICEKRIERYANAQADVSRRAGMRGGLAGIAAGRAAILNARGLTDEQREEALAGLDEAQQEMEADMRSDKDGK